MAVYHYITFFDGSSRQVWTKRIDAQADVLEASDRMGGRWYFMLHQDGSWFEVVIDLATNEWIKFGGGNSLHGN